MVWWVGAMAIGWAEPAALDPDVYDDAIGWIRRLYLEPVTLDAPAMLASAARHAAMDLHWLQVRIDDHQVLLSHGSGVPIGIVSTQGLDDLPAALARLETLIAQSGYDLADADVRLSVLSGMAESLDRHSRILSDERLDRFQLRLSGTQVGIGAFFEAMGDRLVVSELSEGGPAERAGLGLGDELVRIDGRSTVGMTPTEVSQRIRGAAGTPVLLTIRPAGIPEAERVVALSRAELVVPNVTWKALPGNVGYVYIEHISQRTVENLHAALSALTSAGALERGLVIDLRGNTGGSMKESARVADMFVERGLLLRTVGRDDAPVHNLQPEMFAEDDGTEPTVPLVLVVDERTASGSEILTGALLELGRAAVIGTRTYGKGTVQKVYPLGPDARLKLTVARYILANGRVIAEGSDGGPGRGIAPDVELGRILVAGGDMRFQGWDDARVRADWERIVPEVVVGDETSDLALEIARRAVLSARGPGRANVLAALQSEAERARREQIARLSSVLAARVDWSPENQPGGAPAADVTLAAERRGADGWALTATLANRGPALHRALVQIRCPTAPHWDGVVVPFGAVPAKYETERTVVVEVPPGVEPREDIVDVRLVADGRQVRALGEAILPSGSTRLPALEARARLVHDQGRIRGEITLRNLSDVRITGLQTHFGFPRDEGIELLDHDARISEIAPGDAQRVTLALSIAPEVAAAVPLELVVEAANYGTLADWPLLLPLDGTPVTVRPPTVEARPAVRASPLGRFVLPVTVTDDRKLDHVVVVANGDKVAWAAGGTDRIDLAARFPLVAGDNEVVISATDDQGLITTQRVGILGEPTVEAVDAGW